MHTLGHSSRSLEELHETHPGVSKMKSLARCYIWWPHTDSEIENLVRCCNTCQESRPSPTAAPLHPWVWPEKPWSRLHLDFAGPYLGLMYLVLVDAHSKWMAKLRMIFATHGIPQKIVTDNGPSFTRRIKYVVIRSEISYQVSFHPLFMANIVQAPHF